MNSKTTAEEVGAQFSSRAKDQFFIVTGANTGLGLETARVLAKNGATVTLCSRNAENGKKALETILKETPDAKVDCLALDLGNLKSIQAFAENYKKLDRPLNVLINNAGVMACPRALTSDGFEQQLGVNHIGHQYLTTLLLPLLEKSGTEVRKSRVVNLSSIAGILFAPVQGINFDDLSGEKNYNMWDRYGSSKLANNLFTYELTRKLAEEKKNVIAVSLHPGAIMDTELSRHMSFSSMLTMLWTVRKTEFGLLLGTKNIPQGSATTCVAALDPEIVPGQYYSDCVVSNKTHPLAFDKESASKLWTVTEEMIKGALNK